MREHREPVVTTGMILQPAIALDRFNHCPVRPGMWDDAPSCGKPAAEVLICNDGQFTAELRCHADDQRVILVIVIPQYFLVGDRHKVSAWSAATD